MRGGLGDDIYIVDNTADVIVEKAAEGLDTVQSSITYTLSGNLENLLLIGNDAINATGNTLNNVLIGNNAINTLNGGSGIDILQSNAGNDILTDISGVNFFNGGANIDTITGGASNELFVGGTGNDVIVTGTGKDIIAFNKDDGQDTIQLSKGLDNTISLGGGISISYRDLSLSKSGNNLVLNTGNSESITLVDWYAAKTNHTVINLQMIAEAMAGFDAASSNDLINSKVETFNFDKLASQFDTARSVNPTIRVILTETAKCQLAYRSLDTALVIDFQTFIKPITIK